MKKIPTMFVRDEKDRSRVTDVVDPRCEWVSKGEGVATVKWDGTSCLVKEGKLYARYDAKHGKTPPAGAIPCEPEPDPVTGHWPHWVLVEDQPQFKWHREAWAAAGAAVADGTYELIGLRVQGNPYDLPRAPSLLSSSHALVRHGTATIPDAPRSYEDLREYLRHHPMEGIVFHHPDGRMAKVKSRDLGLPWPVKR